MYEPIFWHPWRNSQFDYIGKNLVRRDGTKAELKRDGLEFVAILGDKEICRTMDANVICYVMDRHEVGLEVKP